MSKKKKVQDYATSRRKNSIAEKVNGKKKPKVMTKTTATTTTEQLKSKLIRSMVQ